MTGSQAGFERCLSRQKEHKERSGGISGRCIWLVLCAWRDAAPPPSSGGGGGTLRDVRWKEDGLAGRGPVDRRARLGPAGAAVPAAPRERGLAAGLWRPVAVVVGA
eukprot:85688-Chlamydomonas_euryale.AAC.1